MALRTPIGPSDGNELSEGCTMARRRKTCATDKSEWRSVPHDPFRPPLKSSSRLLCAPLGAPNPSSEDVPARTPLLCASSQVAQPSELEEGEAAPCRSLAVRPVAWIGGCPIRSARVLYHCRIGCGAALLRSGTIARGNALRDGGSADPNGGQHEQRRSKDWREGQLDEQPGGTEGGWHGMTFCCALEQQAMACVEGMLRCVCASNR